MSVVTSVLGILAMTGVISSEENGQLNKAVQAAAGAVMTLASTIGYVYTRVQLKQSVVLAVSEAATTEPTSGSNVKAASAECTCNNPMTTADELHAALTKAGV